MGLNALRVVDVHVENESCLVRKRPQNIPVNKNNMFLFGLFIEHKKIGVYWRSNV